ncbi:hypothetical protein BDP27DRAFT_1310675 [Rhodocollybia butyracea]|uniref:ATP-dependent DNA ligase family profile domain-containing protein n=1 Tax=Rhodocollybia butyracea TaxID=206335 RepID=A0A9P5UG72_9AGAR|nr:hypothetical protein BDP27DRAFT_1310675 [Rhodocollybia butyracea]
MTEPIKFFRFVELVREIQKKSKPRSNAQRKITDRTKSRFPALDVFKEFTREVQSKHLLPGTTSVIFRFLFPEEDHRRKFGLRNRLVHEIADALCIGEDAVKELEELEGYPGNQVCNLLAVRHSPDKDYKGNLDIFQVDELLNELASTSPWSHVSFSKKNLNRSFNRNRKDILKSLYRFMSPYEAAVLTQIIAKDLRGLLYQTESDPTAALRDYNTKAIKLLTKEDAMFGWDPSNRMNRSYRARWDIDAAAKAFESGQQVGPKVGFQIAVPKSQKGRSCKHALSFFSNSSQVWAETKFDGERTQIHVNIAHGHKPRITIFSKSKRDSTSDRVAVHPIILECLGLTGKPGVEPRITKNIILDAEMVALEGTKILEFWRIRRLVRETAEGVRASRRGMRRDQDEDDLDSDVSESSLVSNAAGQHLGLVFFDIMYLEDDFLVQEPYERRRDILENVIITDPGKAMLADRWLIDLEEHCHGSPSDYDEAGDKLDEDEENDGQCDAARLALHRIFAQRLALGEEGLVLKAADSEYNEFRKPWVKLKKDYIEGLGDAVDLVLLAGAHVPDRALELRAPRSILTTFYVGAQTNKNETDNDLEALPHFYIYFTAAYGLSRVQLEDLNFRIKNGSSIKCSDKLPRDGLNYTYEMYDKLPRPEIMLQEPIAVELYGDRFTVPEESKQYELRWPRITKYYRNNERSWRDCLSLEDLRIQAREAMGRVASEEAAEREMKNTFKHREGDTTTDWGLADRFEERVEMWVDKVAEADKPKRARRGDGKGRTQDTRKASLKQIVPPSSKRRKASLHDDSKIESPTKKRKNNDSDEDEDIPKNLAGWNLPRPTRNSGLDDHQPPNVVVQKRMTGPLGNTTNTVMSAFIESQPTRISQPRRDENSHPSTFPTFPSTPTKSCELKQAQYPSPPTSPAKPGQPSGCAVNESERPPVSFRVDPFFEGAAFWTPVLKVKRPDLRSVKAVVNHRTTLNSLHAFLIACRWQQGKGISPQEAPPTRGIVFLDLDDENGPLWMKSLLKEVDYYGSRWKTTDEPRVAIWIFDRRSEIQTGEDITAKALHVFR